MDVGFGQIDVTQLIACDSTCWCRRRWHGPHLLAPGQGSVVLLCSGLPLRRPLLLLGHERVVLVLQALAVRIQLLALRRQLLLGTLLLRLPALPLRPEAAHLVKHAVVSLLHL